MTIMYGILERQGDSDNLIRHSERSEESLKESLITGNFNVSVSPVPPNF